MATSFLTVQQVAERLSVSTDHVYRHANSYPFTDRRLGRRLRFLKSGLEAWMAQRSRLSGNGARPGSPPLGAVDRIGRNPLRRTP